MIYSNLSYSVFYYLYFVNMSYLKKLDMFQSYLSNTLLVLMCMCAC